MVYTNRVCVNNFPKRSEFANFFVSIEWNNLFINEFKNFNFQIFSRFFISSSKYFILCWASISLK